MWSCVVVFMANLTIVHSAHIPHSVEVSDGVAQPLTNKFRLTMCLNTREFNSGDWIPVQQLKEPTATSEGFQAGSFLADLWCLYAKSLLQKLFGLQRSTLRAINKLWLSLETVAGKWPKVTIAPLIVHIAFSFHLPAIFRSLWISSYPWAIFSCYSPLRPVNICEICCSRYVEEFIGRLFSEVLCPWLWWGRKQGEGSPLLLKGMFSDPEFEGFTLALSPHLLQVCASALRWLDIRELEKQSL